MQDFLALRLVDLQAQRALVAIDLQKLRTIAQLRDGQDIAIFAAPHPVHAEHLRPIVAQQRRAERPRNIAPQIQYLDAVEHCHVRSPHQP
ncbi:hypothetical protein SDC9_160324 [bioreactor metagenome]|uniref:Uncharacterized protein n=1 Tax=bioreactor metagenome TaxID=1076179 RepID=A0A645FKR2_9ZZZZ